MCPCGLTKLPPDQSARYECHRAAQHANSHCGAERMARFRHTTKPQCTEHPTGNCSDHPTLEPVGAGEPSISKNTIETGREGADHNRGPCVWWYGRQSLALKGCRNEQRHTYEEYSIHGRRLTVIGLVFLAYRRTVTPASQGAPAVITLLMASLPRFARSLPSPRMHFPPRIGPERVDLVQRPPLRHRQALLRPTIAAGRPALRNDRPDLVIRGAGPQRLPQVDAARGVETQKPRPVRDRKSVV